jgi:alpha-tubulin suppressor-like RCC1 family protein
VSGITAATSIGCGANHCCVVLENETVQCWGHNEFGALGEGSQINSATPAVVSVP